MEKLFENIDKLKTEYDKKREKDRFNVVTALHKERDEVNLHSRFISYLLSPKSGHGMNNSYSELFIQGVLKLNKEKFDLSNFKVLPNEKIKSEYKEIDILIINKTKSQAIIIENKIDAKDSNIDCKVDGYKGQLERYYNTIQRGIDKDGKPCPEYQCNNVYVYYLSHNKQPSHVSIGMLNNEPNSWNNNNIISYEYHIREWLKNCIENTPEEKSLVKEFIKHYLKLIDIMTHNDIPVEERLNLKSIVAKNIESSKYLIDNFKHVKWHTVYEFWSELYKLLKTAEFDDIEIFPHSESKKVDDKLFIKVITDITYYNKDINHGILFKLKDGTRAYISGLGKLSWGIVEPKTWANFESETIEDICFSDFSTKNTYNLIDKKDMTTAVESILDEISEAQNNNFQNLKPI